MGFKLPGRSITSGTSAHASALKQRAYGGTKTWEEGKTASEGKLDDWVKERGKHEKGTAEYDALQNKINKSLGSEKRHGVTEKTVISEKGKRVKSTTTTPGLGREKIKATDKTYFKGGKSKEFDEEGKKTSKQKFRVDKEGKISAKHKDYTQKDEKDKDIVVTTKSKEGEEDKVKSRRSRGKKVGAWLRKVTTKKNK